MSDLKDNIKNRVLFHSDFYEEIENFFKSVLKAGESAEYDYIVLVSQRTFSLFKFFENEIEHKKTKTKFVYSEAIGIIEPFKENTTFLFVDDIITNPLRIKNLIKRIGKNQYGILSLMFGKSLKTHFDSDKIVKQDGCFGFASENRIKNYNSYLTELVYLAGNPLCVFSSSICIDEKDGEFFKKKNSKFNKVFDILDLDIDVFSFNEFCFALNGKKIKKTFVFADILNDLGIKPFFAYKKDNKTKELILSPSVYIPSMEMDKLIEASSIIINCLPIDKLVVGDTTEAATEIVKGPDAMRLLLANVCCRYISKLLCDDLNIPYKVKYNIEENLFINIKFYNAFEKSMSYDGIIENDKTLISDEDAFEFVCDAVYESRIKDRYKFNRNKSYSAGNLLSKFNDKKLFNAIDKTKEEKEKAIENITISFFKSAMRCVLSNYCSFSYALTKQNGKYISEFSICPEESIFSHIVGKDYNVGADIKQFVLLGHIYDEKELFKFAEYMDTALCLPNKQYKNYIEIFKKEKESSYFDDTIIVDLYDFSAYGHRQHSHEIINYLAKKN